MFPSHALLSLILVTLTAVDASLINRGTEKPTLSFASKIDPHEALSILEKDRARAQMMAQGGQLRKRSIYPVTATATGYSYTTEIGVGDPATNYTVLIDTGSSNTWIGANKTYVRTNTSHDTGNAFHVHYGTANVTGELWNDTVTLSPDLVIRQQPIGVASSYKAVPGLDYDGILGLGPRDLSNHTVSGMDTIPTVMDNLLFQGTISQEVLGVYYIPCSRPNSTGELTLGGYDDSVISSPVVYVPLTNSWPSSAYWGIDQSISYGADTILPSSAGFVDTGTILIYIATDAYKQYVSKTGATHDNSTHLLTITSDQYDNLEPLVFHIGGVPFMLTPNAQIWPRSLNTVIGGSPDAIYLTIGDLGTTRLEGGLNFILGFTFLERYYSVYDTTNKRVGFAATAHTFAECN